ncbi:YybH family protein [Inquilinus sp. OTU3971]|uniref:YybH family protein n=1 Tax=Inquilinus sp. OTU3971 TaxID=3043855 RepID=UPI00313E9D6A
MTSQHDSEAPIRALIEERAAALRRKDAKGVVACQAADHVLYSLAPPLQTIDSGAEGLEAWFATWQGSIGYEIHDLGIAVDGDVAFRPTAKASISGSASRSACAGRPTAG